METVRERSLGDHTVRIERDLCIGSGSCVNLAPEAFRLDEHNLVAFADDAETAVADGTLAPGRLTEACELCPVDALLVFDDAGEQIVP